MAAINAQNFDRAAQLIDEAARTKSLSAQKLTQLRDELRRRHEEFDVANFVKLIDTRLQQDKLIDPHNDSAVYYLDQARAAGATAAALQPQSQEINKRLAQMVAYGHRPQRRFADADQLVGGTARLWRAHLDHRGLAARSRRRAKPAGAPAPEQPQYLDLAQSRLAQGKLTEPDNDSALYY